MPDNPSGQLPATSGIGSLRWRVTLFRREQSPAPDLALDETFVPIACVNADIQPAWESTFWQSTQIETPVTHAITLRWHDRLQNTEVIFCPTSRPSDGFVRGDLYRVRRGKELGGRKRFLVMMCELERSRTLPNAMLATVQTALTEPYDGDAAAPPP